MKKNRGKTRYQDHWVNEFPWVKPVEGNQHAARCTLCKYEFVVDTMGRRALQSHAEGKKHIMRLKDATKSVPLQTFFTKSSGQTSEASLEQTRTISAAPSTTASQSSSGSVQLSHPAPLATATASTSQSSTGPVLQTLKPTSSTAAGCLRTFVIKDSVTRAEILWCLQTVNNHESLRAAASSCSLFKLMFPDCEIAQNMNLQKTKISYVITHGLGPFFGSILKKNIEKCDHFVVGYDESLNKIAQRQQMDVNVRFWDMEQNKVSTRYLTSIFLEHTTSQDLLDGLKAALANLDLKKLLQISMDGPNVNHRMLKMLKEELVTTPEDPQLLDIGSCGIHTVHCSFKNGIKATTWEVIDFLRAIYNLFKDVPARRGDFISSTGSNQFALKFCAIRWLENVDVAVRAIAMLPYLEKYVAKVKGTNREPKCKSFVVIENCLKDKLLKAKLTFFMTLAEEVTPFLREYQTEKPMAPFLHNALSSLLRNILTRFVKQDVLKKEQLKSIDLTKDENLMSVKEVDLGYGTRHALRSTKNVTDREMLQFRKDCVNCLQEFSVKMMTKSPLKYPLTKALGCLNPEVIVSERGAETELKSTLEILVKANLLSGFKADKVEREYKNFVAKPHVVEAMKSFSRKDPLDVFWIELLNNDREWSTLTEFLKMLLILSHGNANLERGFSVNKECLVPNQKELSLIAQRQIIEVVHLAGGVDKIEVTKPMMLAVRNAHSKYKESVEAQKLEEDKTRKLAEQKRKAALLVKELEAKKLKLQEETEREISLIQEQVKSLKKQC